MSAFCDRAKALEPMNRLSLAAAASSAISEMTTLESVSLGEQSMWITIAKTNAATANLCILNIEIIQTIGRIRP